MTTYLARLDYLGTLEFSGPDSRSFLQGQTTCDIETLDAEHSLVGAYCNPQGRMICDFRLWQHSPERITATLEADLVGTALETFGKYIVFSKAEVNDVSGDWVHYAVWGDGAAEQAGQRPVNSNWAEDEILWTVADLPQTLLASVPAAAAGLLESRLSDASSATAEQFREREIRAGIGHVSASTSGEFLPQSLNYQHTGQVSFSKGCYTGQEVVARLHYRGKVKRPALVAEVSADTRPEPGDKLHRAGDGKTVGEVINAATTGDDRQVVLVSVATDTVADGVCLGPGGPQLEFGELPYSLEDA